jgi:hypothetical protein
VFPGLYFSNRGKKKIKLLMKYENVTQKLLLGNAVLAALMFGRKYDVILRNGDCSIIDHGNPDNNLESFCIS